MNLAILIKNKLNKMKIKLDILMYTCYHVFKMKDKRADKNLTNNMEGSYENRHYMGIHGYQE